MNLGCRFSFFWLLVDSRYINSILPKTRTILTSKRRLWYRMMCTRLCSTCSKLLWPDLLVGSANLRTCRCVTWWRGSAPRGCPCDELPRQSPFHVPTKPVHAITPYRHESTKWMNWSSVFYNPLRSWKNECCKALMPYQDSKYSLHERRNTHTRWLYFNQKRDSYIEGLHGYLYNDEKYAKSWHLIWVLTTIPKVLFTFG